MSEKERNKLIFNLWSVLIHIMNLVFTIFGTLMLSRLLDNSDWFTPLFCILVARFWIIVAVWWDVCTTGDFSIRPRKLSTLEKAQKVINKGEYKKQLKEDKEELKRRKGISRELKYIEHNIITSAKNGYRETTYALPVEYCEKDVELYLQNHGFKAEIDKGSGYIYRITDLHYCYPLRIEW